MGAGTPASPSSTPRTNYQTIVLTPGMLLQQRQQQNRHRRFYVGRPFQIDPIISCCASWPVRRYCAFGTCILSKNKSRRERTKMAAIDNDKNWVEEKVIPFLYRLRQKPFTPWRVGVTAYYFNGRKRQKMSWPGRRVEFNSWRHLQLLELRLLELGPKKHPPAIKKTTTTIPRRKTTSLSSRPLHDRCGCEIRWVVTVLPVVSMCRRPLPPPTTGVVWAVPRPSFLVSFLCHTHRKIFFPSLPLWTEIGSHPLPRTCLKRLCLSARPSGYRTKLVTSRFWIERKKRNRFVSRITPSLGGTQNKYQICGERGPPFADRTLPTSPLSFCTLSCRQSLDMGGQTFAGPSPSSTPVASQWELAGERRMG